MSSPRKRKCADSHEGEETVRSGSNEDVDERDSPINMMEKNISLSELHANYIKAHSLEQKELRLPSSELTAKEAEDGANSLIWTALPPPPETTQAAPSNTTKKRKKKKRGSKSLETPSVNFSVATSPPIIQPKQANTDPSKKRTHRGPTHGCKKRKKARQLQRYLKRLKGNVVILRTDNVSTLDLPRAAKGWQGAGLDKLSREDIIAKVASGEIKLVLAEFFVPVPYSMENPKVFLIFTKEGHLMFVRCFVSEFLLELHWQLAIAIEDSCGEDMRDPTFKARFQGGVRGNHAAIIYGIWRQSMTEPDLTAYHATRIPEFERLILNPFFVHFIKHVSRCMDLYYPNVVKRFLTSAKWHEERYGIKPHFGYYWNLCINGIFEGSDRVHCAPHVDAKNPVSICALYVYCLPGYEFRHQERSWLVVWELGVVVEIPPGVLTLYPSSLLFHWNTDIGDIEFVRTIDGLPPTKSTALPLDESGKKGRGSIVLFNQATMFQSSETGFDTLKEAEKAGVSTDGQYEKLCEEQFQRGDLLRPVYIPDASR